MLLLRVPSARASRLCMVRRPRVEIPTARSLRRSRRRCSGGCYRAHGRGDVVVVRWISARRGKARGRRRHSLLRPAARDLGRGDLRRRADSVVHGRPAAGRALDAAFTGRHVARPCSAPRAYRDIRTSPTASMEYVGPAYGSDEVIWRGEREAEFSAWFLEAAWSGGALAVGSEDLIHARPPRRRGRVGAHRGACGPGFRARVDSVIGHRPATLPGWGRPANVTPGRNVGGPARGPGKT